MTRTLVLGGARSGKSAYAERLCIESGKEVVYIATARAGDDEMATRIMHHRQRRPSAWTTVEQALALGDAVRHWCAPERLVLIDCLTLWLSNLMFSDGVAYPDVGDITLPKLFHQQRAHFLDALENAGGDLVMVSNEVGMGIVPGGAISRSFTDEAGRLNQAVAAICERAVFIAAGLPLVLKDAPCSPA
ncbi:MAG TPA: bifunctional adenosylcobinamide kinase/adenosylcobinamide-phosphate guanylyltransferase [Oxalobacteraceae bacterium]|nr:bifunctional adenosylcobinamide kinase/adenosylcobinamide-phosphate guanylyltransferase [Oxalobacteraceae bacterium]